MLPKPNENIETDQKLKSKANTLKKTKWHPSNSKLLKKIFFLYKLFLWIESESGEYLLVLINCLSNYKVAKNGINYVNLKHIII